VEAADPLDALNDPAIDYACHRVAVLARSHYDEAGRILRRRPRGDLRAPRLMGAVYAEILRRMQAEGWAPPRGRVRVPKAQLAWLALRHSLAA